MHPDRPTFSVSIVSHGHAALVRTLLADLRANVDLPARRIEIILTLNIDEDFGFLGDLDVPDLTVVRNVRPLGFGENNNNAARTATGEFFVVLNPDVRIQRDPFGDILAALEGNPDAIVAPLVLAPDGSREHSMRTYPSMATLVAEYLLGKRRRPIDWKTDGGTHPTCSPDWIAGTFLVHGLAQFRRAGGFDTRYRMYYEDVDYCVRFRRSGGSVIGALSGVVTHDARRSSHRDMRYFLLHLRSTVRFFLSREHAWTLSRTARSDSQARRAGIVGEPA